MASRETLLKALKVCHKWQKIKKGDYITEPQFNLKKNEENKNENN